MWAGRVLMGSAMFILGTMAFFYGTETPPLAAPHDQTLGPDACQELIEQHRNSASSEKSAADENLCKGVEQAGTVSVPATSGGAHPT